MAIENPGQNILQPGVPDGAKSYCGSPTGDCWWLRQALTLREDAVNGEAIIPGEVPSLEMGDVGGSFKVRVRPHEVEVMAAAWLRRVFADYGMDGVLAVIAHPAAVEAGMDPEIMDEKIFALIGEDMRRSDAKLHRTGWRDSFTKTAGEPAAPAADLV